MSKELTPYRVNRMKIGELRPLAVQMNIDLPADAKRPEYIKAIIETLKAGKQPEGQTPAQIREPGNRQLFDELTQPAPEGAKDDPQPEGKGGPREGAGRKPGVTLEQSRIDNLSQQPNRTVEYYIKWLFRSWAAVSGCKEIALDDDELKEFSIDTTQFLEYHGIRIPQGLAVDSKFVIGGLELAGGRIMIHKAYKARLKAQAEKQQQEQQTKNE